MPKSWVFQSAFNSGAIDPTAFGRLDIKHYYEGLAVATNIVSRPIGGFNRRPGMEFRFDHGEDARLIEFSFNTEQNYLLVIDVSNIKIYIDSTLKDTVAHSYSTMAVVRALQFTQTADTMILVHPSHQPAEFVRVSGTSFTLTNITFTNIPQFDYNDASSPTPVSCVIDVVYTSFSESDSYRLILDGFQTEPIAYSATTSENETRIADALLELPLTGTSGVAASNTGGSTYRVTLSGDSADAYTTIQSLIEQSVNTAAQITSTLITPGTARKEDVWGSTRGWPRTVTFHQNRLWFGGSLSRPQTMWASTIGFFFDFKTGVGRADQAIDVTLNTNQVNEIRGITSNRNLLVFTSGQEFFENSAPVTPESVDFKPQSNFGSKLIQPINLDGDTFYIQNSGKSLRRFEFTEFESSYDSSSASLLASHLLSTPLEMASLKGTSDEDANRLYVLNTDGTMAFFTVLKNENVDAWNKWTTSGTIKSVTSVGEDLFFLVERTINSSTEYYVEKARSDLYSDAGTVVTQASSTTVTGAGHLNGEEIRVKADGAVMANATPSSGSFTLSRAGVDIEYGLNFNPTATTMPLNVQFQDGTILPRRKRVVRVNAQVYQSLGVIIQYKGKSVRLPDRQFDLDQFDEVPTVETGIDRKATFLGWTTKAQVTITQTDPLPMTVLGLATLVQATN